MSAPRLQPKPGCANTVVGFWPIWIERYAGELDEFQCANPWPCLHPRRRPTPSHPIHCEGDER